MNYSRKTAHVKRIHRYLRRFEAVILILAIVFEISTVYDMFEFTGAGRPNDGFPGFDKMLKINPDSVAWIRLDGTHINHPVVQGQDNFEYINKSFEGEFYQGGCVFLDVSNSSDMSDNYIIIHGHHMARGAMFSDLTEYLEESFFRENTTGELITPGGVYQLSIAGVKNVDAYQGDIYYTSPELAVPVHLMSDCIHSRNTEFEPGDKLVLLSTCSGDMTNNRTVLFCRARYMKRYVN